MALRPSILLVAFGFASTAFAGCLVGGGDGKGFDSISVPSWSAGYAWTYATEERFSSSGGSDFGDGDRSNKGHVSFEVFNTAEPLAGEAVYYLKSTGKLDHPLWGSDIFALTQDDLALAGTGSELMHLMAVPAYPHGDGVYTDDYEDPCAARGTIDPTSPEEAFPAPDFPLEQGRNVRGMWSMDGDDDGFGLQWVMRTHGLRSVTVPAGRFDAVLVTLDMTPGMLLRDQESMGGDFKIHAEYWYAPAVKYFAKMSITATVADIEEMGSYEFRSVAELSEFDLTSAPATPAPFAQTNMPKTNRVEVVSDTTFPVNLADGPVQAKFGLADGGADAHYQYRLEKAQGVPATSPLDPKEQEVVWSILQNGREVLRSVGPTVDVKLDEIGGYSIAADIRPVVCGVAWRSMLRPSADTTWSKTYTRHFDPGVADLIKLESLPTQDDTLDATVSWTMTAPMSSYLSGGSPRFVDPSGTAHQLGGDTSGATFQLAPGAWTLAWQEEGPTVYALSAPVTAGGDLSLTLTLQRPFSPPYYPSH